MDEQPQLKVILITVCDKVRNRNTADGSGQ